MKKVCAVCKKEKDIDDFYKIKSKNYFYKDCKKCFNKKSNTFLRSRNGLVSKIYSHQKQRSKERNHPMPNYTRQELKEWLFSQPNFEKLYEGYVKSGYKRIMSPSPDRKDDYKPYTLENLTLVTANQNYINACENRKKGKNTKGLTGVLQFDLKGNLIGEFYSIAQASRETGINKSYIQGVLKKPKKRPRKHIWVRKPTYVELQL